MVVALRQVSTFRLKRHHLARHSHVSISEICQDVCGLQAQVMSAAEMALWARKSGLIRPEIHVALWTQRTLVKTSCMRGTLHLLSVADFPLYITALRRGRIGEMLRVMARYGVTQRDAEAVTRAVVDALEAGPMTRRDLTERVISLKVVGRKAQPWFKQSWWGVIRHALVEGLICYGPDQEQEPSFVLVEHWLGRQTIEEQQSKQMLLRHYLKAYGPASLQDFSRWAGIPTADAKPTWHALGDELIDVSVEGNKGAILREDEKELKDCGLNESICLLPSFDPYLLGHVDKRHLVDADQYKRVYRTAGWISPVVLLNGRIIGVWSQTRQREGLVLEVQLFHKQSRTLRNRIEEEAANLGRFYELPAQVGFAS